MIYLGNLSIEQIEREYCVLFTEEDKKWLLEHHQDKAEKIESDKWHFFDIPRVVIVGSQEFGRELYNRLTKYKFVGQFRIGVEE